MANSGHVVSLEEPRSLVQQLVTKFYPENDAALITNIDQANAKILQGRQKELAASHELLQGIKCFPLIFSLDKKGRNGKVGGAETG